MKKVPYLNVMADICLKATRQFQSNPLREYCDFSLSNIGARPDPNQPPAVLAFCQELDAVYGRSLRQSEPFSDILGPLYEELASRGYKSQMGQFFTPSHVCDVMAMINLSDLMAAISSGDISKGPVRVLDPAVGAGGLLLGAARLVFNSRPLALERLSLTGIDLDHLCARLAAVQLMSGVNSCGIPLAEIDIRIGDSLRRSTVQRFVYATKEIDSSPGAALSPLPVDAPSFG
ncbi:N-6 DNA methylase [Alcanivorax sp. 1008]|uniref:N-6 DNA methylase n=1 Tax=Alcanivorax sp. 1008 TaxID=2816853 RepID=UPI001DE8885D|nr:N-6 DNA methylase [Alcanivorax sp. 1008]MCC1496780.1 SAM-dependent DNA methyltransferase [Alcanivorax sp. 1008]